MKRETRLWLAVLTLGLFGCNASGSEYLKASSQLGGIVAESARRMPDDMNLGAAVCLRRADLDYAQHRLELPRVSVFEWGTGSDWRTFYGKQPVDDTSSDTWEAHCKVFEQADHLFEKAMAILGAYGVALTRLSDAGTYDGNDVAGDAKSAGDLAKALGASSSVGKDLASVGAPLAEISHLLMQRIVANEVRHFIVAIDPSVGLALRDLRGYIDAILVELLDERSRVTTLASSIESKVSRDADGGADAGRGPDRLGALAYGYVVHDLAAHGDHAQTIANNLKAVLSDLADAQSKLAATPHADLTSFGQVVDAWKKDLFRLEWREWR